MASYPSSVYTARTIENRSGVVYDVNKKTVLFAEDIQYLADEINAIETELGTDVKGGFADLKARIVAIEARLTAHGI